MCEVSHDIRLAGLRVTDWGAEASHVISQSYKKSITFEEYMGSAGYSEEEKRRIRHEIPKQSLYKVQLPGRKDEKKWQEAKKAAHKQYPSVSEDNERFWKITQKIYESMGGT